MAGTAAKRDEARKLVELDGSQHVYFNLMDRVYGRAEFIFCPVYKRNGKLKEVWIYPKQQPDVNEYWVIRCGHSESFGVGSWTHKGMDVPSVWLTEWCKEHKTVSLSVYPPDGATSFHVHIGRDTSVTFDNEPKPTDSNTGTKKDKR